MKRLISAAAALMIVMSMAGCSGIDAKDKEPSSAALAAEEQPKVDAAAGIATISIVTDDSDEKGSLGFVTDPVAPP